MRTNRPSPELKRLVSRNKVRLEESVLIFIVYKEHCVEVTKESLLFKY